MYTCIMNTGKVFLDTNIIKFSATELPRLMPRKQIVNWGDRVIEATVHDFVEINRNEGIKNNPDLKEETKLLPWLAEIGKLGKLSYVMSHESLLESWGLRNTDSKRGRFYGAPIELVKPPFEYSRIMFGAFKKAEKLQFDFLTSIKSKRFLELKKATGAYQGKRQPNRNQLLDAFHIWCAECSSCDFLLTLDLKLIRILNSSPIKSTVRVIRPSELIMWVENSDKESHV